VIGFFESYAYEAIFVAVLLDTVGLPVPGEIILLAAGFLVSTGRIEPIQAILVAALGAVLGEMARRRRYGPPLPSLNPSLASESGRSTAERPAPATRHTP
jgi:hypothetical protein